MLLTSLLLLIKQLLIFVHLDVGRDGPGLDFDVELLLFEPCFFSHHLLEADILGRWHLFCLHSFERHWDGDVELALASLWE